MKFALNFEVTSEIPKLDFTTSQQNLLLGLVGFLYDKKTFYKYFIDFGCNFFFIDLLQTFYRKEKTFYRPFTDFL